MANRTQKSAAKPHSDASAKVVVFGVDDDFKPHAAWFPKSQIEPARAAAKQLRLNLIEVTNGTATDLVAKLPAGRIHAPGSGLVPTVGRDLYEQLVATINPRGEAGQDTGASAVAALPATWDAIKPGHLVLAHESLVDGWWEAIVVDRTGDKLTLRMRDYPAYARFTVPMTAVALLSPKAS